MSDKITPKKINVIDQPQKIQGCSFLKMKKNNRPTKKRIRKIEICKFRSNK